MKQKVMIMAVALVAVVFVLAGCAETKNEGKDTDTTGGNMKILFLHHSTGKVIWDGGVKKWFKKYNRSNGTGYKIVERDFPKETPYGWDNYPYDYWNIWVNNAGEDKYMGEPTLEILTKEYGMIIFKHCFPVSDIKEATGTPLVTSSEKTIENYKLQYKALREKMLEFPDVKFLVWTGAALVAERSDEGRGARAREFARWVRDEWNRPEDNIFIWDFFDLETEGGIYLKEENAKSATNSHPNKKFAEKTSPFFCQRIVDIFEGKGAGD